MSAQKILREPVIAVFDIGKTNKKLLLFNRQYEVVFEHSEPLPETIDDDGFPCEDVHALTRWVKQTFLHIAAKSEFTIIAVNVSAYGASLVHVDINEQPVTYLCNYIKPLPNDVKEQFFGRYGDEAVLTSSMGSPYLGNLNSGIQLFHLQQSRPNVYASIRYSLHLPQYIASLFSGVYCSDMTSIGCHTLLWDFENQAYHDWTRLSGVASRLAPIQRSDYTVETQPHGMLVGVGIHDSASALVPYLMKSPEPFLLISTGTWCITLNPFSSACLTSDELQHNCISYMTHEGNRVKASRLFAGQFHEEQTRRLAEHFHVAADFYETISFDTRMLESVTNMHLDICSKDKGEFDFSQRHLSVFASCEIAYYVLMTEIVRKQVEAVHCAKGIQPLRCIFVDGGFSRNTIYMNLLASSLPQFEVFAASVPQASALGAAMVLHSQWNKDGSSDQVMSLKRFG